jgi:hypothetical protein
LQTSARPSSQLLRALAERALVHNSARFKSMLRDVNSPRHAEGCLHRYSPKLGLQRPTLMHEASKYKTKLESDPEGKTLYVKYLRGLSILIK